MFNIEENMWNDENSPKLNDPNNGLESIANANILYNSFSKCKKDTSWKGSVQKYEMNELSNTRELQKNIRNNTYIQRPMVEFKQSERGHDREIKAHHISDRVVQRALNDNVLMPAIEPHLIYDNGASQIGKGLDFSRRRFENHLRNAYNEYGSDCYILFMDFSKFVTPEELEFIKLCIREFEIDVSYMSDEEFENINNVLFNSLAYANIPKELRSSGEKMMKKSMGIGSQTSQISGLLYPSFIDTYCKYVLSLKYYGRYMDDTYIIYPNKDFLVDILYNKINPICDQYGIFINFEKTHIEKITNWITYLKINYKLIEPNGTLIRKICNETIRREQRRFNTFIKLLNQNRLDIVDIINCYRCWKYSYIKYDSGKELHKLDLLFCNKFNLPLEAIKRNIKATELIGGINNG